MFERYTERARRVLFFARYEASQLGSISIETEHLLLGLIREGKGLTSRIFARSHLSLENIRKEIEGRTVFREKVSTSVEIPFSAETKRVLQFAAEEADRLELSLDVISAALADPSLAGWDGFGLAIQAYQKRASDVIEYVDRLAQSLGRKLMVRLVKGAYWDTEIKRAQERGLDGYPVFTRKAMTDLKAILAGRAAFYAKAELQLNTSAQDLAATFELLRARVRQAIER